MKVVVKSGSPSGFADYLMKAAAGKDVFVEVSGPNGS